MASLDEAVISGKIEIGARPVKVCADVTVAFLLIMSQTFARIMAGGRGGERK